MLFGLCGWLQNGVVALIRTDARAPNTISFFE
jgi:hypothetical protein